MMGEPVIYAEHSPDTGRYAIVTQRAYAFMPFIAKFYDRTGTYDHQERFSTAGMAEAAVDRWCDE